MVKKKYLQPQTEAIIIQNSAILANSVDSGSTSEQNAKLFNFNIFDDDEDDEEE